MTEFDVSSTSLALRFAGVAQDLLADGRPESALRALAGAAVRIVPGAEFAGITQGRPGLMETVAVTHELVAATDGIQHELASGPCVDVIEQGTVLDAPDLREDPRWPEFGRRAVSETGICGVLSLQLPMEEVHGLSTRLNLYTRVAGSFDDRSEAIGLILAAQAGLALTAVRSRQQADNLTQALETSREIGIAMGILMNLHKITRTQAFDLLRVASQHSHRKLADIASEVADTGVLDLPEHIRLPGDNRPRPVGEDEPAR